MNRLLIPFLALALCPPALANPAVVGEQLTIQREYDALCGTKRVKCKVSFENEQVLIDGEVLCDFSELGIPHPEISVNYWGDPKHTYSISYRRRAATTNSLAQVHFLHSNTGLKFFIDLLTARNIGMGIYR